VKTARDRQQVARAGERQAAARLMMKSEDYLASCLQVQTCGRAERRVAANAIGPECYRETPSSLRCPHMAYQQLCNSTLVLGARPLSGIACTGPLRLASRQAHAPLVGVGPRRICHCAEDTAVRTNHIHVGMPHVPWNGLRPATSRYSSNVDLTSHSAIPDNGEDKKPRPRSCRRWRRGAYSAARKQGAKSAAARGEDANVDSHRRGTLREGSSPKGTHLLAI
jgi:hypothetical protein